MGPLTHALLAEKLSFRHQGTGRGIHDLDLAVAPGEIVALLGPNGSGKSTLLGLLSTSLEGSGRLDLLGTRVRRSTVRRLRRRLGVASDTPVHVDELPGRANALLFALAAGLPRVEAEAEVDRLFQQLGLGPYGAEPVRGYSFGMRRKLLLVEALAHRPDLLVLDEPTAGLDHTARSVVWDLLAERAGAGTTVVLATHDLTSVTKHVDRVLFLLDGRRVADDSPASLLAALDGVTRIDIRLQDPGVVPTLPSTPKEVTLTRTPAGLRADSRDGSSPLPALLADLVSKGVEVSSVSVRAPGLRDAFEALTGESLPADHGRLPTDDGSTGQAAP